MIFHDFTVTAGRERSHRIHDSVTLERHAVVVFARMLAQHGDDFREPVEQDGFELYQLQWTSARPGAAIATFWHRGVPITTSALVSGLDPSADLEVVRSTHTLAVQMAQVSADAQPGQDLLCITERPAILSVILPSAVLAGSEAIAMIADMETCLMAAFLESLEDRTSDQA